tara:strand:+ start:2329 stop:2466 length:138 start_codon:yes stop_codon:yes gene_type:complete
MTSKQEMATRARKKKRKVTKLKGKQNSLPEFIKKKILAKKQGVKK